MSDAQSHKICTDCKQNKPFSEFYKMPTGRFGLHPNCKTCFKARVINYRHTEAGKAMRRREHTNYSSTEHGKAANRRKVYKYKDHNPDRVKARMMVNNRVNKGTMQRPSTCSKCGVAAKRLEAHHYLGYAREHWLDVVWMCTVCHRELESSVTD